MGHYPGRRIGPARARTYYPSPSEVESPVVELHLSYNAVAQVSELPEGDGFLIRVWPSNGTHEYGGGNMTLLSAVVQFDAQCRPTLSKFDWHEPSESTASPQTTPLQDDRLGADST